MELRIVENSKIVSKIYSNLVTDHYIELVFDDCLDIILIHWFVLTYITSTTESKLWACVFVYARICTSVLGHQIQRMGKGLSGYLCQLEMAWINSALLGSEGWTPYSRVIPLSWWVTRGSSLNSQNKKTWATWLSHFMPFIEKAWASSSSFKLGMCPLILCVC